MTIENLTKGLAIFARHLPRGTDAHIIGAEHDILYICESCDLDGEDLPLTPGELAELDELGFFVDEDSGSWAAYP